MKKINKNDLRLDKEVISSLSENELSSVRGGENTIIPQDTFKEPACRPCEISKAKTGCDINKTLVVDECMIQITNNANPCNSLNAGCYASERCVFKTT